MTAQATVREYLRVSADKSGTLRSPAEQHTDNEQAASREGRALGQPYTENGAVSASRYANKTRHGFDALIADLAAGAFGAQVLMLWESSRGSLAAGGRMGHPAGPLPGPRGPHPCHLASPYL